MAERGGFDFSQIRIPLTCKQITCNRQSLHNLDSFY